MYFWSRKLSRVLFVQIKDNLSSSQTKLTKYWNNYLCVLIFLTLLWPSPNRILRGISNERTQKKNWLITLLLLVGSWKLLQIVISCDVVETRSQQMKAVKDFNFFLFLMFSKSLQQQSIIFVCCTYFKQMLLIFLMRIALYVKWHLRFLEQSSSWWTFFAILIFGIFCFCAEG